MCALTPMFQRNQQEWYLSSTMEYPWLSQVDSFSPSLHVPSLLYPNNPLTQSDDFNNFNINTSLSHNNGSNNSNNDQEEDRVTTVLEKKLITTQMNETAVESLMLYESEHSNDGSESGEVHTRAEARNSTFVSEKKRVLKRISRKTHQKEIRNKAMMDSIDSSSQLVAANWLTDTEIAVQIATSEWTSISDMLLKLEENRLSVIGVSSSVSSTARIFYTLHLQMSGDCKVRLKELFGLSQS